MESAVDDRVPEVWVEEDEQELDKLLDYILYGNIKDSDDERLRQVKVENETNVKTSLEMIDASALVRTQRRGSGGWGIVHEADWPGRVPGKVAVKSPKPGGVTIQQLASLYKEATVQASLRHENVVRLLAATFTGWLVMELADTDLHRFCHGKDGLNWATKLNLLQQAALGLKFLHSQDPPLVHSDVKPQNFLVFNLQPEGFLVKISDFGQTTAMKESRSKSITTGVGTAQWVAPESYENKPLTTKSDVFSFGVMMYEVVTQKKPYRSVSEEQAFLALMENKWRGEDPCKVGKRDYPQGMVELMKKCIKR
ncbi:MAG: protein kinase, partial [Phycisphaerales bacterium]|nr:protein kinase [Phycisphaerales bacterium]